MNNISFCYICFEANRTLKDLLKSEEECLELMAKLRVCVSEVDWSDNKKLLVCDRCIRRLNKAHEFKKVCIQSSETLKLYISEIRKTKEKVEKKEAPLVLQYLNLMKDDKAIKKPPIFLKPLTEKPNVPKPQITKIILTNQSNSFQNVYLNVLTQNMPKKLTDKPSNKEKETKTEEDISDILTQTNTEELSVEIDPLDISMENSEKGQFRSILPKPPNENYDYTNEEKMEFFNSGHFLLQDFERSNRFYCEKCYVLFDSQKSLNAHIMQVHSSQYPYKCEFCGMEFASKEVYKNHLNNHTNEPSDLLNSITLTDFANNSPKINELLPQQVKKEELPEESSLEITVCNDNEEQDVKCDQCDRVFASNSGLVRHKTKLHKNYTRKKYFVKGMKNAKCDICNRMFSTQSYMNLHRKLHDRKNELRRKIFKHGKRSSSDDVLSSQEMDVDEIPKIDTSKKDCPIEIRKFCKGEVMCNYCSVVVQSDADYQWHIDKVHLKVCQYKCQYCDRVFDVGSQLTKHLLTHIQVKCMECMETLNSPSHLRTHITTKHPDGCVGKCCLCSVTFEEISKLDVHMQTHSNIYVCYICHEQFTKPVDLSVHLVDHNIKKETVKDGFLLSDQIEVVPIIK